MGDGLNDLEGRLVQATLHLAEIRIADVAKLGQLAQRQVRQSPLCPNVSAEDVGVKGLTFFGHVTVPVSVGPIVIEVPPTAGMATVSTHSDEQPTRIRDGSRVPEDDTKRAAPLREGIVLTG